MILSAYCITKYIDEALEKEWATDYISKPWDPGEMKMKIEYTLSEF